MLKHLAYCKYQNFFLTLLPKINFLRITVLFLLFFSNSAFAQQLPSCHTLPQFLTGKASPGTNCLGDCNALPAGITANNGTNCLFDCNNMPAGITPVHGSNCAFKVNGYVLPLCNSVPSITAPANSSYFLSVGLVKEPRKNCADLIDLPLCNLFATGGNSGKNCVKKCTELVPATLENRIINRDCIRFCSDTEPDATASDCIALKCHHYINTAVPPPTSPECLTSSCTIITRNSPYEGERARSTCEAIPCTLLTENELNKSLLYAESVYGYKYCSSINKCLDYNSNQLDAIKLGYDGATDPKSPPLNRFCKLHDCRTLVDSSCAPYASDDIAKISESSSYSRKYVSAIIDTTTTGSTIESSCSTKICKGLVQARYPCTGLTFNVPDPLCPAGSTCTNSVCTFNVDCDSSSTSAQLKSTYCDSKPTVNTIPLDYSNSYSQLIDKTWFYLPKPMNKSYRNDNPNNGYRDMDTSRLCYSIDNMNDNGFGVWDGWFKLCASGKPFRTDYAFFDTRSPNVCESKDGKWGNRGTSGWADVCGSRSYASLPDMAHLGYIDNISSVWTNNSSSHKLRVCLRYDNGMIPDKTCGARECGITCACGVCSSVCGSDVCRELTVEENNPRDCADPTNSDKSCAVSYGSGADLDSYLRMRAVGFQADNRVCVMFDWKGGTAYNGIFMNGSESLPEDNTKCLSGTYSPSTKTCINGKNSNDDAGSASKWRAVGLVKYIDQNVTVGGVKGIKDVFGNFFPEANCIRRQLRVSPPNLFNLANYQNSPNLFSPPLIINKAKIKIGGGVSNPINPQELFGPTDFNEPEVEILYGSTSVNISLGIGKNGNETGADFDNDSKKTISTTVFGKTFTATIYAKKLYDPLNGPKFCVFRELRDRNNALIDPPPMVGCVKRNYPVLDNCDLRDGNCAGSPNRNFYRRKFIIDKDRTPNNNLYNKIIVKYQYLVNYQSPINDVSCSGSNKCTNFKSIEFNLTNRKQMNYCLNAIDSLEAYPICFKREDCSILNMECMENEIIYNAGPDISDDSIVSARENCKKTLELCNNRKNIPNYTKSLDPDRFNADPQNNYYGWFNEVCAIDGFNHLTRQVYAYKISGFNGKCVVMPPYNANAECAVGGKMPNCPCTLYDPNLPTPSHISSMNPLTITTRNETYHEAGLCIDISTALACPSIDYVERYQPPANDPFFILQALGKLSSTGYNNTTGVHLSHQSRTTGGLGSAEFNSTIIGNIARGFCNGFWKHKVMYSEKVYPEVFCNVDATWNPVLENTNGACERYSCPVIENPTLNNSNGLYSNSYGSSETSEQKGNFNGFAYWPRTTLTTDFAVLINGINCITGFKKKGATTNFSYDASVDIPASKKTLANASIFGAITGYTGGSLPVRMCNQLGEWQLATNACERIKCPEINPGTTAPTNASDKKLWEETWERFGGAKFAETNASRSTSEIITYSGIGSRQTGICETGIGFYQPAGSAPPTMDCDELGNWTNLQNECLNDCSGITRVSTNEANGFAIWTTVTFARNEPRVKLSTGQCNDDSNYFNYPYPPRRKSDGTLYTLTSATADYTASIPENVNNDTRTPGPPQRTCTKSTYGGTDASRWSGPSSTCVSTLNDSDKPNGCVSGDPNDSSSLMYDERINAGVTRHQILNSSGTQITIDIPWQRRKFGETQVRYCDTNNDFCQNFNTPTSSHNSYSYYTSSRSKSFVIARFCNTATKKWDAPVAYCVASGDLGNSLNASVTATPQSLDGSNHYLLGATGTAEISCNSGYASASTPYIRCDSSTNLNEYKLVKNDDNNCVKFCDTGSDGGFSGSSYDKIKGSVNTRFYSGNTTTASCKDEYPCGSQTVTATCTDSGWSIPQPGCRTCNGCNSSSPDNVNDSTDANQATTLLTRTLSEGCATERFGVQCLMNSLKSSTNIKRYYRDGSDKEETVTFPSVPHKGEICIVQQKGCCNAIGTNCYAALCMSACFICIDGTWEYDWDHSNKGGCNYTSGIEYDPMSGWCGVGKHWESRLPETRGYRGNGCYDYTSGDPNRPFYYSNECYR
jgi:hypothetical protein